MKLKDPVNLNSSCLENMSHFETIFAASLQTLLNNYLRVQLDLFANKDCLELLASQIDGFCHKSLINLSESLTVIDVLKNTNSNSFQNLFAQPLNFVELFIIDDAIENIRVINGSVFISKEHFKESCSKFEIHKLFNDVIQCKNSKFIRFLSDDQAQFEFSKFISHESILNTQAINYHINNTLVRYFKNVVFHNLSWCIFNTNKTVTVNQVWLDALEKIGMPKAVFARVFQNSNKVDHNSKLSIFKSTKGLNSDEQVYKTLLRISGVHNHYQMELAA